MDIPHNGRKHIGIVGAGIAGLHLGLRLRQFGMDCTIITDRSPEQVAAGQLTNTVVHWPATLRRERVLQVYHWPTEEFGFRHFRHIIQGPEPIVIRSQSAAPARAVDYRIYLSRLMEDFADRGGRLELAALDVRDIDRLADRFDLIVVATPGNGFAQLFVPNLEESPYDRPQRYWLAGLFVGFRSAADLSATVSVAPGHSEALAFPLLSRTGMGTALLINSLHRDELAMLRVLSSRPGRAGFCGALLRKLKQMHPAIHGQIDAARFDLQGPDDLAWAAVTPIVRASQVHLGGGKYAVALGDVHVTVDPALGQGANIGSYSAFALADAIAEARSFDLEFCLEMERCRAARLLCASRWTNASLGAPDDARMELMLAMSRDQRLANEYIDNFDRPERQWDRTGSADRIRAWVGEARREMAFSAASPERMSLVS